MKIDAFQVKSSIIALMSISLLLIIFNGIHAISDYYEGRLVIEVVKQKVEVPNVEKLGFENTYHGDLTIKPSLFEAFIFEQDVYRDGGFGALYFLGISIWLLMFINNFFKVQNFRYTAVWLYRFVCWIIFGYVFFQFSAFELKSYLVERLTNSQYTYDVPVVGNISLILLAIMLVVVVLGFIYDQGAKLKQENDLTI